MTFFLKVRNLCFFVANKKRLDDKKSAHLVKLVYTKDSKSVPVSGYRFESDSEYMAFFLLTFLFLDSFAFNNFVRKDTINFKICEKKMKDCSFCKQKKDESI